MCLNSLKITGIKYICVCVCVCVCVYVCGFFFKCGISMLVNIAGMKELCGEPNMFNDVLCMFIFPPRTQTA